MDIGKYSTIVEIPVQWGDMDAAQHVNNVVYLRWIECARVELFRKINGHSLQKDSIGPILAWQECKYISPVVYPDTVMVGVRISEFLSDRMVTETKIYSKENMELVAIGRQMIVAYNFDAREKTAIPEHWKIYK